MRVVLVTDDHPMIMNNGLAEKNVEYTSPAVVEGLTNSLVSLGLEVVRYNKIQEFKKKVLQHLDDYVINFDYGFRSRIRNMSVSALCEIYGIACMNPSPYAQVICQDKFMAKQFASHFGIRTPASKVFYSASQFWQLDDMQFPLIVKPNAESNSMGISMDSVVYSKEKAIEKIQEILPQFSGGGVIVEEYIAGQEVTVAMLQLPTGDFYVSESEVVIHGLAADEPYIESFEVEWGMKTGVYISLERSFLVDEVTRSKLIQLYQDLFENRRNLIRIDGRVREGEFYLVEINANPGMNPRGSFVPRMFERDGYSYTDMIKLVLGL